MADGVACITVELPRRYAWDMVVLFSWLESVDNAIAQTLGFQIP